MITGIIIILIILYLIGIACSAVYAFVEDYSAALKTTLTIVAVISWGFALGYVIDKAEADDRPCVRYETTMMYNAAVKTSMPVKYCAQYGEWVND